MPLETTLSWALGGGLRGPRLRPLLLWRNRGRGSTQAMEKRKTTLNSSSSSPRLPKATAPLLLQELRWLRRSRTLPIAGRNSGAESWWPHLEKPEETRSLIFIARAALQPPGRSAYLLFFFRLRNTSTTTHPPPSRSLPPSLPPATASSSASSSLSPPQRPPRPL